MHFAVADVQSITEHEFTLEISGAEVALLVAGIALTAVLAALIIVLWRRFARE